MMLSVILATPIATTTFVKKVRVCAHLVMAAIAITNAIRNRFCYEANLISAKAANYLKMRMDNMFSNELSERLIPVRASPLFLQASQLPLQEGDNGAENKRKDNKCNIVPSQTELLILWTIQGSKEGVYGLDIQRAIQKCSNGRESISLGTLYSLLKRLRKKGYIKSREGKAIGGGAKRQYYYLTDSGKEITEYTEKFFAQLRVWSNFR